MVNGNNINCDMSDIMINCFDFDKYSNWIYQSKNKSITIGGTEYCIINCRQIETGFLDLGTIEETSHLKKLATKIPDNENSFVIYYIQLLYLIDDAGNASKWEHTVLETAEPIEDFRKIDEYELKNKK